MGVFDKVHNKIKIKKNRFRVGYDSFFESKYLSYTPITASLSFFSATLVNNHLPLDLQALSLISLIILIGLTLPFLYYISIKGPFYAEFDWNTKDPRKKDKRLKRVGCAELQDDEVVLAISGRIDKGVKEYSMKFETGPELQAAPSQMPPDYEYDRETQILRTDNVSIHNPLIRVVIKKKDSSKELQNLKNEVKIKDPNSDHSMIKLVIV